MSRTTDEELGRPDDLPKHAVPFWPDLQRWPTVADVAEFKRRTRRHPDVRMAVLNGLRSWAEIDVAPIWAWAGAFLALIVAGMSGTIALNVWWAQMIAWVITISAAFIFLVKMMALSTTADTRRRRAHIWLRALEDAL